MIWGVFAYLMTLMALKATADVNQAAANVNLGVKAFTDMKKVREGHRRRQTFEINFDKECGLT